MSEYIHKSHNVSVLLYHFVCPAKYRRIVFSSNVEQSLKEICIEISKRYDIVFVEIGSDQDHVHFLIQSVPMESPTKIIRIVKSITAKEIFKRHPEVKQKLWGGEFWSKGFYVNTVGKHGDENTIQNYVKSQGKEKEYKKIHSQQLSMF
ncbi:IS200/IS605 family transposase [Flavobacterium undicola]|uniref:IS200/IS605 family transposase n=1 Tax=Flavobacterium undicola TaxID=1932779 RepID=UPI00137880C6|nr:IS200/IS605 family transposase [Flavobacterium undicola]MBA0885261.1 IS200/IS605 family transposase [Flavobacterium undicola]